MGTYATHPWRAEGPFHYSFSVDGDSVYDPVASDNGRVISINEFKSTSYETSIALTFKNECTHPVRLYLHNEEGYREAIEIV